MDFTNFYGFVKKMVQKNQYTYNVPPRPSANPYGEARSAEFDWTDGTDGHQKCPLKFFKFTAGKWFFYFASKSSFSRSLGFAGGF